MKKFHATHIHDPIFDMTTLFSATLKIRNDPLRRLRTKEKIPECNRGSSEQLFALKNRSSIFSTECVNGFTRESRDVLLSTRGRISQRSPTALRMAKDLAATGDDKIPLGSRLAYNPKLKSNPPLVCSRYQLTSGLIQGRATDGGPDPDKTGKPAGRSTYSKVRVRLRARDLKYQSAWPSAVYDNIYIKKYYLGCIQVNSY